MQNIYKKRILFIGVPDMAYVCLDALLSQGFNIVGAFGDKKASPTYNSFKSFVLSRGVKFIEYDDLEDATLITKIRAMEIDLAVVCSFNQKIPQVFLNSIKDGVINVHPSLLPDYKGGNPYSRVIANGESQTGVTLHFMDEGFDEGEIICQKAVSIDKKDTMGTIFNLLNYIGSQLLVEALKIYETQPLPRFKQPKGIFKLGKNFSPAEMRINFANSAINIERQIRALNPFLLAQTSFRGNEVKIFTAEVDRKRVKKPCGTIVKVKDGKIYIATGDGLLVPDVIQFGTYFVASSKDFVALLQPKVGEVFGEESVES